MPYEFADDPITLPQGRYVFADVSPQEAALQAAASKGSPTAADYVHDLESGVLRGGARLAGMGGDLLANAAGLGVLTYDAAAHYGFGADWANLPTPPQPNAASNWLISQMNKSPVTSTELNRPDSAANRYLATAGDVALGAAAGGGGALGPTVRTFAGALPSAYAGQAVIEAQPFGKDHPTANLLASALTQLATGVGVPAATKLAIRGPSGANMQQTAQAFRDAGAEPTVGQASESRPMRFAESALAKVPGGAGVIHHTAEEQATGMGQGVNELVGSLTDDPSLEGAGRAITEGVRGPGGALEQFRTQSRALYDAVDEHIAPDQPVTVRNTLGTLNTLTEPIQGAEQTSALLVNPRIRQYRDALLADLGTTEGGPMQLPYRVLSGLRSQVGEQLGGNELISGIPTAQLRRLYGSLSQDMEGAARQAGPDAVEALDAATTHYREGAGRMDMLGDLIDKPGGPEAVFNSAMNGTQHGASRLRTIMDSLPEEHQNTVTAAVLNRMGRATPGAQNAAGDVYSPQTFLTNWNKMSAEAKDVLFGPEGDLRDRVNNLADVAENLRTGSRVFSNPSGTGPAEEQIDVLKHASELGVAILGGHAAGISLPHAAMGAVGIPATAYLGARAMTSPTVVDWAGRPAFGSTSQVASFLAGEDTLSEKQRRLAQALQNYGQ